MCGGKLALAFNAVYSNLTDDAECEEQARLWFAGNLTLIVALIVQLDVADVQSPRVRRSHVQSFETLISDERVTLHSQKIAVRLPDPRNLMQM